MNFLNSFYAGSKALSDAICWSPEFEYQGFSKDKKIIGADYKKSGYVLISKVVIVKNGKAKRCKDTVR